MSFVNIFLLRFPEHTSTYKLVVALDLLIGTNCRVLLIKVNKVQNSLQVQEKSAIFIYNLIAFLNKLSG